MSTPIEQSCFTIIVRSPNHEIIDRGTGFFINADGYFITAGHVVVDPTCRYYALIGNELPMDIKFKEYVDQQSYRSNLYMDLAFGKIDHQPKNFIKLSPIGLQPGQSISLNGFDNLELTSIDNTFSSYPAQTNHSPAEKTNKITKELFVMVNVYTIAGLNLVSKGLRGGPIVHNNFCCAIVNNSTECLTSLYIIEQLETAGVQFSMS